MNSEDSIAQTTIAAVIEVLAGHARNCLQDKDFIEKSGYGVSEAKGAADLFEWLRSQEQHERAVAIPLAEVERIARKHGAQVPKLRAMLTKIVQNAADERANLALRSIEGLDSHLLFWFASGTSSGEKRAVPLDEALAFLDKPTRFDWIAAQIDKKTEFVFRSLKPKRSDALGEETDKPQSVVYESDSIYQTLIRDCLKKAFGVDTKRIVVSGKTVLDSEPAKDRIVADALDGSANFNRTRTDWAYAISILNMGKPQMSFIGAPSRKTNVLLDSNGTSSVLWINGVSIDKRLLEDAKPPIPKELGQAWVGAPGNLSQLRNSSEKALHQCLTATVNACGTLRVTGSAVLDLMSVFFGELDARWSLSVKDEDVLAGKALIEFAGGVVYSLSREGLKPWQIGDTTLLAARSERLAQQLFEQLKPHLNV